MDGCELTGSIESSWRFKSRENDLATAAFKIERNALDTPGLRIVSALP
jgi:hypothetical protein